MIQFPGQISGSCLNATRQIAWNPTGPAFYLRVFFTAIRRTYGIFVVNDA